MTRLSSLWHAIAAVAITGLIVLIVGALVSPAVHMFIVDDERWRWAIVAVGLSLLTVGICIRREQVFRREAHNAQSALDQ